VGVVRAAAVGPRHPRDLGRLRRGLLAIRAGAGEEAFLLGCGAPLGAAVGIVDGMRIGPDVAPHWLPEPPLVPGIEAMLPSTRSALRSILARSFLHRRLWQNDPDCLMARSRDTRLASEERHALAVAIASSGGMTLFSDDVASLGVEERSLVRETLALARRIDALGIPARVRALGLLDGEIASGLVARGTAASFVALVNAGETTTALALPPEVQVDAGAEPEPFVLEGMDWFDLADGRTLSWDRIRTTVESGQAALARVVDGIARGRVRSPLGEVERFDLVLGITCHAVYHAGQIQLVKRLIGG